MYTRNLKRVVITAALCFFTCNAFAIGAGFYLGLMTGPVRPSNTTVQAQVLNSIATTPAKFDNRPWGVRFYLGYQIVPWAGIEGGLNYVSDIKYKSKANPPVPLCSKSSVKFRNFDIEGKLAAPLWWFEVYAKAGLAIIYQTSSGALNPTTTGTCGSTKSDPLYRALFAIGAGYTLSQNWVVDASITRIASGKPVGNINFLAIGIAYHFVDRYCGQFLCDD